MSNLSLLLTRAVSLCRKATGRFAPPAVAPNNFSILVVSTLLLVLSGGAATSAHAASAVVAWGNNQYGQSNLPAGLTNVVAIAGGGFYHNLALRTDGTVVAWGDNSYGQTDVPASLSNVIAVAAGGYHSLALRADGTTVAWGSNGEGQTSVPSDLSNVVAIAGGGYHSLALREDGTVAVWGQYYDGSTWFPATVPPGLSNVVAVAGGGFHSLALKADGTVLAWGDNRYGQTDIPPGLSNVVAIAGGGYYSLALRSNGTVTDWPAGGGGYIPADLSNVVAVAAGDFDGLALRADGTLVAWGQYYNGSAYVPITVPAGLTNVVQIACGESHNVALTGSFQPVIVRQPINSTNNVGSMVQLSTMATGLLPLYYRWQANGTNLLNGTGVTGANTPALTLKGVQASDTGSYRVVVTNAYGSVTSAIAWVVVTQSPPFIVSQPLSRRNNLGTTAAFHVETTGTLPMAYQWRFNETNLVDGSHLSGAATSTLTLYNVQGGDSGSYSVIATNVYGSVTSAPASLTVRTNKMLAQFLFDGSLQDSSGYNNIMETTNVVLTNGTIFLDGVYEYPPPGVLGGFRAIAHVPQLDYRSFTVSVDLRPDQFDSFRPLIVGGASYRWLELWSNQNHHLGLHVNNWETGLSFSSVVLADDAWVRIAIAVDLWADCIRVYVNGKKVGTLILPSNFAFNAVGTDSEEAAKEFMFTDYGSGYAYYGFADNLEVFSEAISDEESESLPAPPMLTIQPVSSTNLLGSAASLSVAAIGSPPLAYQWRFNSTNLTDNGHISGAATATLTLNNVQATDAGDYTVVVTNAFGSVTSSAASLAAVRLTEVVAWGNNLAGQLDVPANLSHVVGVACGEWHSLALQADGSVASWQSGGGNDVPSGLSNVVALAGGDTLSLALRADSTVTAWGYIDQYPTTSQTWLSNVVAVAAGDQHCLALRANGTVAAWGENTYGQTNVPSGLRDVVAVAGGRNHSLALRSDGSVVAWGDGGWGQTTVPGGLSDVVAVAGGWYHSLALRADGTVVAWGDNSWGQAAVPAGLSNVVAIAAGQGHSLVLRADGTVVAWGNNDLGQTDIPAGLHNVVAISAGSVHSLALVAAVTNPVQIVRQPLSQTVSPGDNVSLFVLARGTPALRYQWQLDGVDITGATNAAYTIINVQSNRLGAYSVVVANSSGSVQSQLALLSIAVPPGDDFSSPIMDLTKWGPDIHFGTGGQLVQTNGQLQFQGSNTVLRPWIGSYGSYTQDWEVVADVNVGSVALTQNNAEARVFLSVADHNDLLIQNGWPGDLFSIALNLYYQTPGPITRILEAVVQTNATMVQSLEVHESTTNQHASLRISFNAATKTLTSWYDISGNTNSHSWVPLSSLRIDGTDVNWNMTDASAFRFGVGGSSRSFTASPGDQMYVDNFAVVGGVQLGAPLFSNPGNFLSAWRVAKTGLPNDELALGVAVDTATNIYVTGWFDGSNDFGGTTLTSYGGQDAFVAKYDSAGTLQWVRQAGGTNVEPIDAGYWEAARGVGVDGAGNVYVAGGFLGRSTFSSTVLTSQGLQDAFLAKYNSGGTLQWVRQGSDSSHSAYGTGIAVDGAGNSLVVGYFEGQTVSFGAVTATNAGYNPGAYAAFIVKYDSSGTAQWAQGLGGGDTYSTTVGMDALGNGYVGGSFTGTLNLGSVALTSAGDKDGFLAKFNSGGVLQWARQVSGPDWDGGRLGVDAAGNCWFVGNFTGSASLGGTILTSQGGYGLFVARYDTSGNLQWVRQADGTDFFGTEGGCAVDAAGNCYIPGIYSGAVSFGSAVITNRGGWDCFVAKYDASGYFKWVQTAGGTLNDGAFKLAVDAGGACYTAGWFQWIPAFGTNLLEAQGYRDVFVAKLAEPTATPAQNTWQGCDDFSMGISATNWTAYQAAQGQMAVLGTNNHASFVVPTATTAEQNAYLVWHGNPTAAEDWTVDIKGHNSAAASVNGSSSLQLAVLNTASISSFLEGYVVSMVQRSGGRGFGATQWQGSGYTNRAIVSTTYVDFGLRLVYHSASGMIEAWYDPGASGLDWTLLDSISLADFSSTMTASSTFTFAILADTYYGPIPEGAVWADEFCLTGVIPSLQFVPSPAVSNGFFLAKLTGPVNANVVLQSSVNLTNWTPLSTNTIPASGLPLNLPIGTNKQQFFRARFWP